MDMDGEEVSRALPEDLVERILAMVPFPYVFKARVLSKSWLARLSPISSHDDEEKKRLAIAFQKKVGEYATKWATFCPVFLGQDNLIAYDRESQSWRYIPTLSFLPENQLTVYSESRLQIKGALLLMETRPWPFGLSVVNVLTRTWKDLQPAPEDNKIFFFTTELVNYMETYKVIKLGRGGSYYIAEIYDGQSGSWSSKRTDLSEDFEIRRYYGEYLDGVLYWVGTREAVSGTFVVTFNVKEETFKVLQISSTDIPFECDIIDLLVCNGSLLMIVYGAEYGNLHSVIVVRLDLGSRRWLQVTRGPPDALNIGMFNFLPASDGSCIYFAGEGLDNGLAYNVQTDDWSPFSIPESVRDDSNWTEYERHPIQLGLNPFVDV